MILLDTHVWIWFVEGNSELKKKDVDLISVAVDAGEAWLASISLWEVSMIVSKGRMGISLEIGEWIRKALWAIGGQVLPLTPEIAIDSCHLPDGFHSDPADRIIVATSRVHGAKLVTKDKGILEYAKKGHVKVA